MTNNKYLGLHWDQLRGPKGTQRKVAKLVTGLAAYGWPCAVTTRKQIGHFWHLP